MKMRTYDEWRELGFQVRRGERASGYDARRHLALFSRDQVEERDDFDRRHGFRFEKE